MFAHNVDTTNFHPFHQEKKLPKIFLFPNFFLLFFAEKKQVESKHVVDMFIIKSMNLQKNVQICKSQEREILFFVCSYFGLKCRMELTSLCLFVYTKKYRFKSEKNCCKAPIISYTKRLQFFDQLEKWIQVLKGLFKTIIIF